MLMQLLTKPKQSLEGSILEASQRATGVACTRSARFDLELPPPQEDVNVCLIFRQDCAVLVESIPEIENPKSCIFPFAVCKVCRQCHLLNFDMAGSLVIEKVIENYIPRELLTIH